MPSEPKVNTIVIKSPFGGLIPNVAGTGATIPNAGMEMTTPMSKGEQYTYGKAISLFRPEMLGHIAPGHIFSSVTDSGGFVNQLALNGDVDSNSQAWMVLANMRLVEMNPATPATSAKFDPTMSGAHSGHTLVASNNPDVLVLKDLASVPLEYALWTVEDNTDADIAIIKTDGTGENDAFFSGLSGSGVLTKGVPLKLCIGPDGDIYCTNGSYGAQIDITGAIASATGNPKKLNFGPGWVTTGVCTWKGYVVFIGSKQIGSFEGLVRGATRVWMYNTTDSNYTTSYDIPDNFANGIFSDGVNLWALTNGRNNSSKVWNFNGNDFIKKAETTRVSVSSTPVQGNMEIYQDSLCIATVEGSSQGIFMRLFNEGLHNDTVFSDGTFEASAVGMLKNLSQGQLFCGVSFGSPSTYKIYYQASFSQYYTPADFRTRLIEIGVNATIQEFRIYFSQFGTGASLLLSLMRGYDTIGIGSGNDILKKTISFAAQGALKGYRWRQNIPNVSSFYMNLRFNHASVTNTAAIVERIEIDWIPNVQ